MNLFKNVLYISFIGLISIVWGACEGGEPGPGGPQSFETVVASGGSFEAFTTSADSSTLDSSVVMQGNEDWICITKEYDFVKAGEQYFNFNPSSEIIWPGNLLQGNSITESNPNPIVVDRGAGCVTIDLVNGSKGTQQCMDTVSQGNIIQALNRIIDQNNGILPAQFTYTFEEVQSQEQMAFKMGVNFNTLSTDVKGKLSISSNQNMHSYLVTLTQNFYTMIFEKPTSYAKFFDENVSPSDLQPYIGPGNPGTYISSVTYGRKFFLLVESTSSRLDIKASIKATYDAGVTGGSLAAGAKYVKDLESSNIKVFALGGDQGLALSTFNGDMQAVGNFLTQGGDYRTGVPLSYVVRSLETHQDVAIKVATKYETVVCEPKIFDDNPPPFTAFWGDAIDSVGAASMTNWGTVVLFNMAGTEYYEMDIDNLSYTGPFSIKDPNAPLKVIPMDDVGAAQLFSNGNLYFHDKSGVFYSRLRTDGTHGAVTPLRLWGRDDHPWEFTGVGAACEDITDRVVHFNKAGDQFTFYNYLQPFGRIYGLWEFGVDNSLPLETVGAAVRLQFSDRYYILFDETGTNYAIYQSGGPAVIGYYQL
ncbi:MAG: thiol-activated cytolysin family protein [Bacteroidota bacterium]